MSEMFVIRNQDGQYLSKQREWVSGRDASVLYRTAHRDEAVNTVFEVSSKDIYLRAETVACTLDHRQLPQVEPGPEPILQPASQEAEDSAEEVQPTEQETGQQAASTENPGDVTP